MRGWSHDRLRSFRERGFDLIGIDVVRSEIGVNEYRSCTDQGDSLGGGDEAERVRDHFVAGSDFERHRRDHRSIGAGRDGYCMLHTRVISQLLFQLADLRSHDVLAVVQDGLNAAVELGSDSLMLSRQADEMHSAALREVACLQETQLAVL